MSPKSFLGEFEQMVLLAILQQEKKAFALEVRREIERSAGRDVSRGAFYTTLERLEIKGFLKSRAGASTPERGGRARRHFGISDHGREALRRSEGNRVAAAQVLGVSRGALRRRIAKYGLEREG